MKDPRKQHPLLYLLFIPGALVLDVLLLYGGSLLDTYVIPSSGSLGHSAPVFTIVALILDVFFLVVGVILGTVLTIVKSVQKKRAIRALEEAENTPSSEDAPVGKTVGEYSITPSKRVKNKKNPKALLILLAIPIWTAISYFGLLGLGLLEVSVSEQPEVGFIIPAYTLIAVLVATVIAVVVALTSIVLTIIFFNRKSK